MRQLSCPICGKVARARFKPFCSKRCADLDLGKWLGGNYRIETDEEPDIEELLSDDRYNNGN